MKKVINISLLLFFITVANFTIFAQAEGSGHDIGFSVGPNFSLTDLGGSDKIGAPFLRDVDPQSTRFFISAFYRYNVNKWFAVRANLMYGMLTANDNNTNGTPPSVDGPPSDSWYRARRNLNFTTHIFEFQGLLEANLKKYVHDAGAGDNERWAPYVGAGLGFFYFDPYTTFNGGKVKLRPLGTEGQYIYKDKKKYSNLQFDLVALVGIKYNITNRVSLALEGLYHQTFTDYLDDVSGNYVNPDDLSKLSPTAQALQNRVNTGRFPENTYNFVEGQYTTAGLINSGGIGQQRGDKKNNDQFFNVQLTLSVALTSGMGKSKFRGNFSCPTW
jgi:opacity protein-like surface antigen